MWKIALTGFGIAAVLGWVAPAGADPTPGHVTYVVTATPDMLCQIGSDDAEPGVGPNVVCQIGDVAGFARSGQLHQSVILASGAYSYRDANIGTGGDDFNPEHLVAGQTYQLQGWTVVPTDDGISFINDATGHGAAVDADRLVESR